MFFIWLSVSLFEWAKFRGALPQIRVTVHLGWNVALPLIESLHTFTWFHIPVASFLKGWFFFLKSPSAPLESRNFWHSSKFHECKFPQNFSCGSFILNAYGNHWFHTGFSMLCSACMHIPLTESCTGHEMKVTDPFHGFHGVCFQCWPHLFKVQSSSWTDNRERVILLVQNILHTGLIYLFCPSEIWTFYWSLLLQAYANPLKKSHAYAIVK